MEVILNSYYANNAKKLHTMVDKILFKLKFQVYNEDFYSLANEVFVDVLNRYDKSQSFDGFLYSCLMNRFKTEMTKRNRQKRQADRMAISIDAPIGDSENFTWGDIIPDKFDVESIIFDEKEDIYSTKMVTYLNRLSHLQKKVLRLIIAGYTPYEIKEELYITDKQYEDCQAAIRSYKNVSVLF